MHIEQIAQLFGMFVAVIGGTWVLGKMMRKRAYDDGKLSSEHTSLIEDVDLAHEKIRKNQADIHALEKTNERNFSEHKAIIDNQEQTRNQLDKIYDILVAKK